MPVNTVFLGVRGASYQQAYRRTNAEAGGDQCSADRVQLDTVSYPLPIGVGCQSWSVQPSRQR